MTSQSVERYAGAVGLTLVGLAFTLVFRQLRGVSDALIFAATVALSARYFGTGPSLVASGLSIIAIDLTILPPLGSIELTHPEELTYVAVFAVLVLVISGTTHSLREAQADAERLAQRSSRLLEVTTALSEAALPHDVARVLIGPGLELTEAMSGLVGVIDGGTLRVLERGGPSSRASTPQTPTIQLDSDGPLAEALRSREVVWLDSREQFRTKFPGAFTRLPLASEANAFAAFPLMHGSELVGGLALGFGAQSAFGATDRTFAHLLAQSVANALARARALEREQNGRMEAEMLSRAREDVLGVVAHDLRNPLNVVGSVVEVLRDLDLSKPERDKFLASGSRAVQQMNRLISDLLDVIRLETGHLTLDREVLSAEIVLSEAAESLRPLASQRRITVDIETLTEPIPLRGDRMRLAQVFSNLLGNAIKFTPAGGRVVLRAHRDEGDAVFEVADTGPGVTRDEQVHLFDRFWQARRSDRRGVGLGLPIAKGIVEAHGGRMWVESEPGAGSHFYFAIPVDPDQESADVAA